MPLEGTVQSNVAVGRVTAVLTGERSRNYEPAQRAVLDEVGSDSERFVLALSPGNYELIRVQLNEGPFLSIARLASGFLVGSDPITYLGIWRFGVDSPKYARMVSLSMVNDEHDRADIVQRIPINDSIVG